MGLTDRLIELAVNIIHATGYLGVGLLMVLESMIAPVPSEAVLPFAGFLVSSGEFSFITVVVVATVGSIIGSLISYALGYYGGRPFVVRFGRYALLNEHHLDITEQFFRRWGQPTIFISRFIPVVRHLISIPAGIGRMPLGRFVLYTTLGALGWNTFLTWVGVWLRDRWDVVGDYTHWGDVIIVAVLGFGVVWFVIKQWQSRSSSSAHIDS